MRARIVTSILETGNAARDYIRLVCEHKQTPARPAAEDESGEGARELLEVFRNHRRKRESDHILTGRRVITAMDEQLRGTGWPYSNSAGLEFADSITKGSLVSLPGDDRSYETLTILWDRESIKIRDDEGNEYLVPWKIIRPWPKESE